MDIQATMKELSVIIPAYNEEAVIADTLKAVLSYLKIYWTSYEIIVVDDASTDSTAAIVRSFPEVSLLRYTPNRGKGYAVKHGMRAASGSLMLFMDADNSTSIDELSHFVKEIKHYDIVIGSRALSESKVTVHQPIVKRVVGRLGNKIIRSVLSLPFHDTQCGFKLFSKRSQELFALQRIERWGFDFELLFLARKRRYRIYESPVQWVNNFDSKVSVGSYLGVLRDVLRVRLWSLLRRY